MAEADFIAGWEACRKSLYVVCEEVEREADDLWETSPGSGYARGMTRAAKSIARGFGAMQAMDDDNLIAAVQKKEGSGE